MLSLVGRVASASASGALRGLSPSAALPQAQLLLRAAPAGVHPGKRLPGGASSVLLPVTLSLGLSDPFSIRIPGQRTTVQPRSARTVARGSVDITSSVPFCEARVAGSCLDLEVLRGIPNSRIMAVLCTRSGKQCGWVPDCSVPFSMPPPILQET
jgi:hypothetical protein